MESEKLLRNLAMGMIDLHDPLTLTFFAYNLSNDIIID